MRVYEVTTTEATKEFTEAIFLETLTGIFVESPGLGFFKHPKLKTRSDLIKHLNELKQQGFEITETLHTVKSTTPQLATVETVSQWQA